ncbi:MAG: phenylalanine--tRNA ligase subunit beta, partial [Erysipelotrichaceae bacterium]|nr:phenylalanine--tRNA ligase subunit beta [Erysipelotrichaceae bacterium]
SPEELADRITHAGLEVEGMETMAYGTNLCIGHVDSCVAHPNSDHLHVCQVNVGTDVRQIVCGAPNVAEGQNVIVALPGCKLHGGEIKAGAIRGEKSDGMICSLSELGVDKKQLTEAQLSGIEVLPSDAPVGSKDVLAYLSLDDTILDVGLTPNRNDCLAMWAMAKQVGAVLNRTVTLPDYSKEVKEEKPTLTVQSHTEKCPLFLGKIINHVTIKESPKWIKDALQGAGVKSINNVVDISNLVMLETGQPLHFYDLAKIPAREITVVDGLKETYTALDGIGYEIEPEDIMITTGGKAIGIAGIMGGDDSKIDEETKGIIIEAAQFNHVSIRNSSRRLNCMTEAAMHFTKGVEPLAGVKAVARSVQLLMEYADASGIEETVVCGTIHDEKKKVSVTLSHINALLGTDFDIVAATDPLARLDFHPEVNGETITCTIPSYRTDIEIAENLIEEIIQILGFENIVSTLPKMPTTEGQLSENGYKRRKIKTLLHGMGMTEVVTYSLVSPRHISEAVMPADGCIELSNPISDERRYYRNSLTPSMLDTIAYNQAHSNENYGLYEIANVYDKNGNQQERLSLAISNTIVQSKWQKMTMAGDFYVMKGRITAVLEQLGFDEKRVSFKVNTTDTETFHPGQSAEVYLGKDLIGIFGRIHPKKEKQYDIEPCVIGELNLNLVYDAKPSKIKFVPICKFPSVSYDLAVVVKEDVMVGDLLACVRKAGGKLMKDVEVFDIYRGKGIEEGHKSIAISMTYQSEEKTLTDNDLAPCQKKVMDSLVKDFNAQLRG